MAQVWEVYKVSGHTDATPVEVLDRVKEWVRDVRAVFGGEREIKVMDGWWGESADYVVLVQSPS